MNLEKSMARYLLALLCILVFSLIVAVSVADYMIIAENPRHKGDILFICGYNVLDNLDIINFLRKNNLREVFETEDRLICMIF
jgi:hypothetical protein